MKFQVQFGGLYLLDHIRPQCGPVLRLRVPPSSLTESSLVLQVPAEVDSPELAGGEAVSPPTVGTPRSAALPAWRPSPPW